MEENSTKVEANGTTLFAGETWFDPIEAGIRDKVRGSIQELLEQELTAALGRARHERAEGQPTGQRNKTRERQLPASFGPVALSVSRGRMATEDGGTQEWRYARCRSSLLLVSRPGRPKHQHVRHYQATG